MTRYRRPNLATLLPAQSRAADDEVARISILRFDAKGEGEAIDAPLGRDQVVMMIEGLARQLRLHDEAARRRGEARG